MKTIIIKDDKNPAFFYKIEVDEELPFGIDSIVSYVDDNNSGVWRIEAFGSLFKHASEGYESYTTKVVDGINYGGYRKIEE